MKRVEKIRWPAILLAGLLAVGLLIGGGCLSEKDSQDNLAEAPAEVAAAANAEPQPPASVQEPEKSQAQKGRIFTAMGLSFDLPEGMKAEFDPDPKCPSIYIEDNEGSEIANICLFVKKGKITSLREFLQKYLNEEVDVRVPGEEAAIAYRGKDLRPQVKKGWWQFQIAGLKYPEVFYFVTDTSIFEGNDTQRTFSAYGLKDGYLLWVYAPLFKGKEDESSRRQAWLGILRTLKEVE